MRSYLKNAKFIDAPRFAVVIAGFFAVLLLARNAGMYPTVFADEWHYSLLSRLLPISQGSDPGYLYFGLYSLTNYCGDGYLGCVRVFNVGFYLLGVYFIYLVAQQVMSRGIATAITLGMILAPLNVYTAYFMPESMYFCLFWILSWFVTSAHYEKICRYGIGVGVLIAVLSMIKPHAFFLAPGIAVFAAYKCYCDPGKSRVKRIFGIVVVILVSAVVVRLMLGGLIAGKAGLSLFGHRYSSMAADSESSRHIFQTIFLSAQVLTRHVLGLALIFGVPIAILINSILFGNLVSKNTGDKRLFIVIYLTLLLGSLLVVTSVFTVTAEDSGPYESLERLHMRYYNFLFPLFFIIAGSVLSPAESGEQGARGRIWIAALVGMVALFALFRLPGISRFGVVDGPEIRAFTYTRPLFWVLGIFGIIALAGWAYNSRLGGRLFLFLFFPLFVLSTSYSLNQEMRGHMKTDAYDDAGIFARRILSSSDRTHLVVAGADLASLYRTLFYVDSTSASLIELAKGAPLTADAIPDGTEWVLLVGDHGPTPDTAFRSLDGNYSLLRVAQIDFTRAVMPGPIERLNGLSTPESAGAWSVLDKVEITLKRPLPRHFVLKLKALAFGPNAGSDFFMTIGSEEKPFKLSSTATTIEIPFDAAPGERVIVIKVPHPLSPKEAGVSADERPLGIQLVNLEIFPVEGD